VVFPLPIDILSSIGRLLNAAAPSPDGQPGKGAVELNAPPGERKEL
jgi:hypothetical protein